MTGKRRSRVKWPKAGAAGDRLWSPRYIIPGTQHVNKDGKLSRGIRNCQEGFHVARGYNRIRPAKKWCVRDCHDWNVPGVQGKRGRCLKPKTAWMTGLLSFYKRIKADDPSYTFSRAMTDFRAEYYKDKRFL